jgi:hypothetical protein
MPPSEKIEWEPQAWTSTQKNTGKYKYRKNKENFHWGLVLWYLL